MLLVSRKNLVFGGFCHFFLFGCPVIRKKAMSVEKSKKQVLKCQLVTKNVIFDSRG